MIDGSADDLENQSEAQIELDPQFVISHEDVGKRAVDFESDEEIDGGESVFDVEG